MVQNGFLNKNRDLIMAQLYEIAADLNAENEVHRNNWPVIDAALESFNCHQDLRVLLHEIGENLLEDNYESYSPYREYVKDLYDWLGIPGPV